MRRAAARVEIFRDIFRKMSRQSTKDWLCFLVHLTKNFLTRSPRGITRFVLYYNKIPARQKAQWRNFLPRSVSLVVEHRMPQKAMAMPYLLRAVDDLLIPDGAAGLHNGFSAAARSMLSPKGKKRSATSTTPFT